MLALVGCAAPLPDPESPGAQVLQRRCAGCHAIPAPNSMTLAMWEMQLERMRGLFAQRGMPWLSTEESAALDSYLRAQSGHQ
jgi:hypothetical protein